MTFAILLALAAAAAAYLLRPFVAPGSVESEAPPPAIGVSPSADAVDRALRDLELDWATGKLSDDDYRAQRAQLGANPEGPS